MCQSLRNILIVQSCKKLLVFFNVLPVKQLSAAPLNISVIWVNNLKKACFLNTLKHFHQCILSLNWEPSCLRAKRLQYVSPNTPRPGLTNPSSERKVKDLGHACHISNTETLSMKTVTTIRLQTTWPWNFGLCVRVGESEKTARSLTQDCSDDYGLDASCDIVALKQSPEETFRLRLLQSAA